MNAQEALGIIHNSLNANIAFLDEAAQYGTSFCNMLKTFIKHYNSIPIEVPNINKKIPMILRVEREHIIDNPEPTLTSSWKKIATAIFCQEPIEKLIEDLENNFTVKINELKGKYSNSINNIEQSIQNSVADMAIVEQQYQSLYQEYTTLCQAIEKYHENPSQKEKYDKLKFKFKGTQKAVVDKLVELNHKILEYNVQIENSLSTYEEAEKQKFDDLYYCIFDFSKTLQKVSAINKKITENVSTEVSTINSQKDVDQLVDEPALQKTPSRISLSRKPSLSGSLSSTEAIIKLNESLKNNEDLANIGILCDAPQDDENQEAQQNQEQNGENQEQIQQDQAQNQEAQQNQEQTQQNEQQNQEQKEEGNQEQAQQNQEQNGENQEQVQQDQVQNQEAQQNQEQTQQIEQQNQEQKEEGSQEQAQQNGENQEQAQQVEQQNQEAQQSQEQNDESQQAQQAEQQPPLDSQQADANQAEIQKNEAENQTEEAQQPAQSNEQNQTEEAQQQTEETAAAEQQKQQQTEELNQNQNPEDSNEQQQQQQQNEEPNQANNNDDDEEVEIEPQTQPPPRRKFFAQGPFHKLFRGHQQEDAPIPLDHNQQQPGHPVSGPTSGGPSGSLQRFGGFFQQRRHTMRYPSSLNRSAGRPSATPTTSNTSEQNLELRGTPNQSYDDTYESDSLHTESTFFEITKMFTFDVNKILSPSEIFKASLRNYDAVLTEDVGALHKGDEVTVMSPTGDPHKPVTVMDKEGQKVTTDTSKLEKLYERKIMKVVQPVDSGELEVEVGEYVLVIKEKEGFSKCLSAYREEGIILSTKLAPYEE